MATKKTTAEFAKELYDKFSLTLTSEYLGAHTPITFTCTEGHSNTAAPTNLLRRGYSCKACKHGTEIVTKIDWNTKLPELEVLIAKATPTKDIAKALNTTVSAVNNAIYKFNLSNSKLPRSYSDLKEALAKQNRILLTPISEYQGTSTLVSVVCSNNHEILQQAGNITSKGTNCPKCFSAKGKSNDEEALAAFIESIYKGWIIKGDRSILNGKELDIVLPDLGLAFEYNGNYWHSEAKVDKYYHLNKTLEVESMDYRLVHIPEHLWLTKRPIWESYISNLLNKSTKIYARKCIVKAINWLETKEFLESNHLQGAGSPTGINLALKCENEILAVMTFSKPRFTDKYEYELVRFCTKLNTSVTGGASKLLRYFENMYTPESVVSYANRYWSQGNVYKQLGFTFDHNTEPGYYYAKRLEIISRYKAQKHKLQDLLDHYDPALSETENMANNGYNRVWDSGNQVWVKLYHL